VLIQGGATCDRSARALGRAAWIARTGKGLSASRQWRTNGSAMGICPRIDRMVDTQPAPANLSRFLPFRKTTFRAGGKTTNFCDRIGPILQVDLAKSSRPILLPKENRDAPALENLPDIVRGRLA